jgi:hypothetical protein
VERGKKQMLIPFSIAWRRAEDEAKEKNSNNF